MYTAQMAQYEIIDQVDRNSLHDLYNTATRKLNSMRQDEYNKSERSAFTTTYREEIVGYGKHGNMISHFGNNTNDEMHIKYPRTYLKNENPVASNIKPFLQPSYQNLTQSHYMAGREWHNYSKNYLTSDDNVSLKQLDPSYLQQKSKFPNVFKVNFKPIADVDHASVHTQEANGFVNDYFVSKKHIKNDLSNIKEKFAESMQLADYLRNKRTDTYVRGVFGTQSNGQHNLDIFSDLITKLIAEMNNLISHMYMIDYHAISLRKMFDELTKFTLKVIDSNIADRNIKPIEERIQNMQTEKAIVDNKNLILKNKDSANKTLSETQKLLNTMKLVSSEYVNKVLEEAKCIFMEKLDNEEYQRIYLRDSNGYLKKDGKRALDMNNWFKLANDLLRKTMVVNKIADKQIQLLTEQMDVMSFEISRDWTKTHEIVKNQLICNDLVNNDRLINEQRDCKREILELKENIDDTKRRLNTVGIVHEVNHTQLKQSLPNFDMLYDTKRFE